MTVYAVLREKPGVVHVGVGLEHATTGGPSIATSVHVPLFQVDREGPGSPSGGDGVPDWLVLGRVGGRVEISVDITLSDGPPAAGDPALGGARIALAVPTNTADRLGVELTLRDLELPGATQPQTFSLDAERLDDLDDEVLEMLLGLVQAQAAALDPTDTAVAPFSALTGLLGLRRVPGLPPLPLAELPQRGLDGVVSWIEEVLADDSARDAWLSQAALLLGATVDAARDAVVWGEGSASIALGVRVGPGAGGRPVLVPWLDVALDTRAGAVVTVSMELLRADTGTGTVAALPALAAQASFGTEAGGPALLTGDPGIGGLRLGVGYTRDAGPATGVAFTLTLHNCTLNGRTHPVLDLSSPDSALDAAESLVDDALVAALTGLGDAGTLVAALLGVAPPAGISGPGAVALLADPLAALTGYWQALVAEPTAAATVLGQLRALMTGEAATPVAGSGTPVDPWLLPLAAPLSLGIHVVGGTVVVVVSAATDVDVLDGLSVRTRLALTLVEIDLPGGVVVAAPAAMGRMSLRRTDDSPLRLDLDLISIEAAAIGLVVDYRARSGLAVLPDAPGLVVEVTAPQVPTMGGPGTRIPVSLPTVTDGGTSTPAGGWEAAETALAALLREIDAPLADAALSLLGWGGGANRLSLAALLDDPEAAVADWLAGLVLDCANVRAALGPVAALLSGFTLSAPYGSGSLEKPYRCPVAGDDVAPSLTVWLDPGCPPLPDAATPISRLGEEPPETAQIVATLEQAARRLDDVDDLMVARSSLDAGLQTLLDRWTGTDGLVAQPSALPDGVTSLVLDGFSYAEMLALGADGGLADLALSGLGAAVVHVCCDTDRPDDTMPDAVAATGPGTWFVTIPTPEAAGAARSDRTPVAAQAQHLTQLLSARNDPVTLVGYGAAGAAVVQAAATLPAVSAVATVGTPWATSSVTSLSTGLGGDALRLLDRLARTDAEAWPDRLLALECTPLERLRHIIARSVRAASGATTPSAGDLPIRSDLTVAAVFGALEADDLALGLGAYVRDGLDARTDAASASATSADAEPTSLHLGTDVPVIDVDLGGITVGAGAGLELLALEASDDGLQLDQRRTLTVTLRLSVSDGWLVGGPGSANPDVAVRWVEGVVTVPLDQPDQSGTTVLVLHEATALGVYRERWVVRVDDVDAGVDATGLLTEVRIVLSEVAARMRAASSELAAVLDVLGLSRDSGLDPDAVDRWFYDTAATARAAVAGDPAAFASALRPLSGAAGTGARLEWTRGAATVSIDTSTGEVSVGVAHSGSIGVPAIAGHLTSTSTGVSVDTTVGSIDPGKGGLALHGTAGTDPAAGPPALSVHWQLPGAVAAPARLIGLLPSPDTDGIVDLLTALLPAAATQVGLAWLRKNVSGTGRTSLDTALDALGLLDDPLPNTVRPIVLPLGLVTAPAGWLRHAAPGWRTDLAASGTSLLDALRAVVDGGAAAGAWALGDEVVLTYTEQDGRLRLAATVALDATVDGASVRTRVTGGFLVDATGPSAPVLEASTAVNGSGPSLNVQPDLALTWLHPPQRPLPIYPSAGGLGSLLATATDAAVPAMLEALRAHRDDATDTLLRDVGRALHEVAAALDLLRDGQVDADRVALFAADPAGWTLARLPAIGAGGLSMLATALAGSSGLVAASQPTPTSTRLALGAAGSVALTVDGSSMPALTISASADVSGIGRVELQSLRLGADGASIRTRIGPASVSAGALTLHPVLLVRAGAGPVGFSRAVGIGLATDAGGSESVEVRWTLDATPPALVAVDTTPGGEALGDSEDAATRMLAIAASIAASVLVDAVADDLGADVLAGLRGVVFTDASASTAVDPALLTDLLDPEALLDRLVRLAWNLARSSSPPSFTIDGAATVGLVAEPADSGRQRLGVRVSLADRLVVAPGETQVELEADADWITGEPDPGLSIFVLEGPASGSSLDLHIEPSLTVAGVGIRVVQTSGPLLDLGSISLDAIAVHAYGTVSGSGGGGGVRLLLDGLAFAPSGQGGSNTVANGLLADAGSAGTSARPSLSPSFAVQQHPGESWQASLRAGEPPGPWWVVVQRQLGPLYIDAVGLDTAESGGQLSRITLLFNGSVELFGLTAAVDRLSLSWLGGDVFDPTSWAVDLQGLAVSADLSGIVLAGGLLKTEQNGDISYVGMLMGRFGVYGLSVFGGYTDADGSPSFFVFGALNGPIGGPPAFFVTGIGGGLGINRGLRVPDDLSQFGSYPFIKALDPAASAPDDPMAELASLSEYFPAQAGTFWFAAGISFTSFALVDGVAVISVSFGSGLEVNLFGLARMALPRPQAALVSIELALLARFSTDEGVFLIQAQLTDNSWLLYPEVRLTGGFVFGTWWKGALAGQFVLSIGGYHPDFDNPGYPDVPRLGLVWQVTNDIVIKGGAYFALTSEALMAGVDVEVSADFGWAWARISFGAHGIVYFDPFWFEVRAYARISAGIEIETWLGDISLSISLGARITVAGPDFHGKATLEVGPCEFTVPFGSTSDRGTDALGWSDFVAKYLEDDGGGRARVVSAITGRGTLPAATGGQTGAPTPDGSLEHPFEVVAEFEITVVTTAPTQTFTFGTTSVAASPRSVAPTLPSGASHALGLTPMQKDSLSSTLALQLAWWDPAQQRWVTVDDWLAELAITTGTDSFPLGVWGTPRDPDADLKPVPKGEVVRAGNSVLLVASAEMDAVGPMIDYYRVEHGRRPLPLRASGTDRSDLLRLADDLVLAQPSTAGEALTEARRLLFADSAVPENAAAQVPAGLLPTGARSRVAAAAFAGERSAPPRFGSLADGLAPQNGQDPTSRRLGFAVTPAVPAMRDPFVAAYLPALDAVPQRPGATTVRDTRIKRRPAPSTDSVQARLGRSLPIQLRTTPVPATESGATVLPAGDAPFTATPVAARSFRAGPLGLGIDDGLVGGLLPIGVSPRSDAPDDAPRPSQARRAVRSTDIGSAVRAGDVIVLSLPDAAADIDERAPSRPRLEVRGSARVVALHSAGRVLDDVEVADGEAVVPPGTATLAIQADGDLDVADGFAGWHHRSMLVPLSSRSALGAGCVVTLTAPGRTGGRGQVLAGAMTSGASSITTRFSRPVRTVAVLLEGQAPQRLDPMALELDGAEVATGPDGRPVDPVLVMLGETAALLYEVVGESDKAVTVRVRSGGQWTATGVLGTRVDADQAAQLMAASGVGPVTGRLTATTGNGCQLRWLPGRGE